MHCRPSVSLLPGRGEALVVDRGGGGASCSNRTLPLPLSPERRRHGSALYAVAVAASRPAFRASSASVTRPLHGGGVAPCHGGLIVAAAALRGDPPPGGVPGRTPGFGRLLLGRRTPSRPSTVTAASSSDGAGSPPPTWHAPTRLIADDFRYGPAPASAISSSSSLSTLRGAPPRLPTFAFSPLPLQVAPRAHRGAAGLHPRRVPRLPQRGPAAARGGAGGRAGGAPLQVRIRAIEPSQL